MFIFYFLFIDLVDLGIFRIQIFRSFVLIDFVEFKMEFYDLAIYSYVFFDTEYINVIDTGRHEFIKAYKYISTLGRTKVKYLNIINRLMEHSCVSSNHRKRNHMFTLIQIIWWIGNIDLLIDSFSIDNLFFVVDYKLQVFVFVVKSHIQDPQSISCCSLVNYWIKITLQSICWNYKLP